MTAPTQELLLGTRITGDLVVLAPEERRRHLYIIGQTGAGKSTLLLNLIAQSSLPAPGSRCSIRTATSRKPCCSTCRDGARTI